MRLPLTAAACHLLAIILPQAAAAEARVGDWRIEGRWRAWTVQGEIHEADQEDISGVTSVNGRHGLLVGDESRGVHEIEIDAEKSEIRVRKFVNLLPGSGKELDLEAVTPSADGKHYFASGSYSVARKTGKVQEERRRVFLVPLSAGGGAVREKGIEKASLMPLLETDAMLAGTVGRPTDQGGLDIEGLAHHGGQLLFGLRAPLSEGMALVLEAGADSMLVLFVFDGASLGAPAALRLVKAARP
jgi:hypothetical protein